MYRIVDGAQTSPIHKKWRMRAPAAVPASGARRRNVRHLLHAATEPRQIQRYGYTPLESFQRATRDAYQSTRGFLNWHQKDLSTALQHPCAFLVRRRTGFNGSDRNANRVDGLCEEFL